MRILSLECRADLERELERVGVDAAAWSIFAGKNRLLTVKLGKVSVATANMVKQLALTVGADCAVHRSAISGRVRQTEAVLFGTRRQLERLAQRLQEQPECAARLAPMLLELLARTEQVPELVVGGRRFRFGSRTYVMGVLNVTPDSFSDGGRFLAPAAAIEQAERMAAEGADFIDIGAESTRPGALPVPPAEQKRRLRPVLEGLKGLKVPLSIDTMSAAVAGWALDMGVAMVNDVSGLSADPDMPEVVARAGVPCVVMHMKGRPRTMQKNPVYSDLMAEIVDWLRAAVRRAVQAGISEDRIIVDPGIGFGKTVEHNFEILRRLGELRTLGRPILVGPSRKSFIGRTLGVDPDERLEGTLAACVLAARNGADILRVHDVRAAVRALRIADRIDGRGG